MGVINLDMFPQTGTNVDVNIENKEWFSLTYEEKNRLLFLRQKETLDMLLERGAISQAQHDKCLHDLIEKMGMKTEGESKQ